MTTRYLDMTDRWGRPLLRMLGLVVITAIGLAIAVAFWQWAIFGREVPKLPGEAIAVAALPYLMQAWDHFTRSAERQAQIAMGKIPGTSMPNPHGGGPDTP